MSERKRGRNDKSEFRRYGPAAAALRRGHVFRDAREAKEQVTVDSILRDAVEMNRFHSSATTSSNRSGGGAAVASDSEALLLHSREELALYRQKKRAEMETKVIRGGKAIGNWVKFARWEAQQGSFERMRNVMERALQVHGLDPHIWRDYAELEATYGFVEEARLVFQRGVKLLPAAVDLWLKYALLEQAAGTGEFAREVFLKWTHTKDAPSCAYELHVLFEVQQNNRAAAAATPVAAATSSSSTALVVSQSPYAEHCRPILRRYVETSNSTDAWLFYYTVEQTLLKDTHRAIKVLQTATEVLPREVLYGPIECRIPLALAEAYGVSGNVEAAREIYRQLLSRVTDQEGSETVLRNYRSFERLHAQSVEEGEYIAFLEAKKRYEERLSELEGQPDSKKYDYDTALSLYVLLASEIQRLESLLDTSRAKHANDSPHETTSSLDKMGDLHDQMALLETQASDVLQRAVTRFPSPTQLSSSQQHAILVCSFAKLAVRRALESGDHVVSADTVDKKKMADNARELMANTIKQFPFDRASCPQLWSDAAALEEHVFQLCPQARRLLSVGFQVTKDMYLMDELLRLEERQYTRELTTVTAEIEAAQQNGLDAQTQDHLKQKLIEIRSDYMRQMRAAFQSSIKASPLEASRWHQYAKWEEQGGGLNLKGVSLSQSARSRAAMLYKSCIAALSEEARKSSSLDQRCAILKQVDETWGRWMSLELRCVRRSLRVVERGIAKKEIVSKEKYEELNRNAEALHQVCIALLDEVVAAYRHEALSWSFSFRRNSGDGVLSSLPPTSLPKTLKPAILRVAEACDVVVRSIWQDVAPANWKSKSRPTSDTSEGEGLSPHVTNISSTKLSLKEEEEEEGKVRIREVFHALIEKERREIYRVLLAGTSQSFEETKLAKTWREALLGPLLVEWGRYEAVVGGSLAAVSAAASKGVQNASSESASGGRRRTRLFKKNAS